MLQLELFHGRLAVLPSYRPTRLTHPLPRTPPPFHTALGLADTSTPPRLPASAPDSYSTPEERGEKEKKEQEQPASVSLRAGRLRTAAELGPCTPPSTGSRVQQTDTWGVAERRRGGDVFSGWNEAGFGEGGPPVFLVACCCGERRPACGACSATRRRPSR